MKITPKEFAEKVKLEVKTAKLILDVLGSRDLDMKKFDRVLWKMESFIRQTKLQKLLNAMKKKEIERIVDDMVSEDAMHRGECVACNEGDVNFWLFNELQFAEKIEAGHVFSAGDVVEIQVMRTGKWAHPFYGEVKFSAKDLKEVKTNFDKNLRGVKLAVDENHESNHKALGWFEELFFKNKDSLFAKIKLTKKGADLLTEGAYAYFSPEVFSKKRDEETGKTITNLLVGGAFTNRPFFKSMSPLMANEDVTNLSPDEHGKPVSSQISLFFNSFSMKKFLELLGEYNEATSIDLETKTTLEKAFGELQESDKTPELTKMFNDVVAKFDEEGGEAETEDEKTARVAKEKEATDAAAAAADDDDDDDDDEKKEKKVEAKEPDDEGNVKITAAEYEGFKAQQKENSKLIRTARKQGLNEDVKKLQFSESNKKGIVLPKSKKRIVKFALALSEEMASEFIGIMNELETISAAEIGHDKETKKEATDPKKEEKIAFIMKDMDMNEEDAKAVYAESEEAAAAAKKL